MEPALQTPQQEPSLSNDNDGAKTASAALAVELLQPSEIASERAPENQLSNPNHTVEAIDEAPAADGAAAILEHTFPNLESLDEETVAAGLALASMSTHALPFDKDGSFGPFDYGPEGGGVMWDQNEELPTVAEELVALCDLGAFGEIEEFGEFEVLSSNSETIAGASGSPTKSLLATAQSPQAAVVSPVWVTAEHEHFLARAAAFSLSEIFHACDNADSLVMLGAESTSLQTAEAIEHEELSACYAMNEEFRSLDRLSEQDSQLIEEFPQPFAQAASENTGIDASSNNDVPTECVSCADHHLEDNDANPTTVGTPEEAVEEILSETAARALEAAVGAPVAECPSQIEQPAQQNKAMDLESNKLVFTTPNRDGDFSPEENPSRPNQSPVEKTAICLPDIQQSEEEFALELETIQRKAEEQLRQYVERQLQQKKQDFERKTQAAAVKLAAEWKQDGLNIDEVIDLNFKAYAEQYEDLYTKALALKRTFERGKLEFEQQIMAKYRDMQQSSHCRWGDQAYAPQRIAFEEVEEQDPLDRPLSSNRSIPENEFAHGQTRKKQSRPFAGEILPELKRAAIRKPFKVPSASPI